MKINDIEDLWDLARIIHEARRDLAYGKCYRKEPWPKYDKNYTHSPIAYVDLALASAKAVLDNFKIDLSLSAGPAMSEVGTLTI